MTRPKGLAHKPIDTRAPWQRWTSRILFGAFVAYLLGCAAYWGPDSATTTLNVILSR